MASDLRNQSTVEKTAKDYWSALIGNPPVTERATLRRRLPQDATYQSVTLSHETEMRVQSTAFDMKVEPDLIILAALFVALEAYYGTSDVVVTVEAEGILAATLSAMGERPVLPIRLNMTAFATVAELVRGLRDRLIALGEVDALMAALKELSDDQRNALHKVVCRFLFRAGAPTAEQLRDFGQIVVVDRSHPETVVRVICNDSIDAAWRSFCEDLGRTIGLIATNSACELNSLSIVADVTPSVEASSEPHRKERCIHEWIEDQSLATPDATALIEYNRRVRFRELNEMANAVARALRRLGVRLEVPVGVHMPRSIDTIIVILGILKAGGAYVPLDPSFPQNRLVAMLAESCPLLVISTATSALQIPGVTSIGVDEIVTLAGSEDRTNLDVPVEVENLAYILYTSGSTGQPIGTMEVHRSLVARLSQRPLPDISSGDRCGLSSSFSFGITASRVFIPLALGLTVIVISDNDARDVARFIEAMDRFAISSILMIPAMLREVVAFVRSGISPLANLRAIAVTGSPLSSDLAAAVAESLPHVCLVNLYGAAELGSTAALQVMKPGAPISGLVAVPNTTLYVVGPRRKLSPPGVVGELYVASPYLSRGYLDREDLTADRFIDSPFAGNGVRRMFRTGDLARIVPGGLELLGRADNQLKIRGFRVEAEEVEAVMRRFPGVREAVVCTSESDATEALIAYVAGDNGLNLDDLRDYLSRDLPGVMIPSHIVVRDKLPTTATGKVDRSLVRNDRTWVAARIVDERPPEDSTAGEVARICAEVLELPSVSLSDSFVALGGDSLTAARFCMRLQMHFGSVVFVEEILRYPSVRQIAECIDGRHGSRGSAACASIGARPGGLSAVTLSISQEALLGQRLRDQVDGRDDRWDSLGFAFALTGAIDPVIVQKVMDHIVDRHEVLRTTFVPTASLRGYTITGWAAVIDMCRRLGRQALVRFDGRVVAGAHVPLRQVDLSKVESARADAIRRTLATELVNRSYDYARPPFLEAILIRESQETYLLYVAVSHLVFDGWSGGILQREFCCLYDDMARHHSFRIPDLPIQFADYAAWQRDRLVGERLDAVLSYWSSEYDRYSLTTVDSLNILGRGPRQEEGEVVSLKCGLEGSGTLRALAAEHNTTPFVLFFVAVALYLHDCSRRGSVGLLSYFANRTHQDTHGLIGDFTSCHLLGIDISADMLVGHLIQNARAAVIGALAHQEIPFATLSSELAARADREGRPRNGRGIGELPITCEFVKEQSVAASPTLRVRRVGLPGSKTTLPLRFKLLEKSTKELVLYAHCQGGVATRAVLQSMVTQVELLMRNVPRCGAVSVAVLSRRFCAAAAAGH